jgi:hypothetical protein
MRLFLSNSVRFVSRHLLLSLILLGFLHSLIYVFIIPPWWNHDEAGHFEYVWLVANRPSWPEKGDYDNDLRLKMGNAALRFGVENPFNFGPENRSDDPIHIGVPQVGELPLYFIYASLPLRFLKDADVLVQMYTVRLFSAILTAFTLFFTWKTTAEFFPRKAWMTTLFLALLPGFINVMTSINSDAAAGFSAGLFLWMSARILKRGFSWLDLLGWLFSIVLCFYSRDITRVLLLSAPLVLWGRIRSIRIYLAPIVVGLIVAVVATPFVLTYSDAQYWFVSPASSASARVEDARAPFGHAALASLPALSDFGQALPFTQVKPLRNRTLTLGFWVWADQPGTVQSPVLDFVIRAYSPRVQHSEIFEVDTNPRFYTIQTTVPRDAVMIKVLIPQSAEFKVYYDGLLLVTGSAHNSEPKFDNATLSSGVWDGKPFTNLMRNASAESTWINVAPWVDESLRTVRFFRRRASLLLATLQDPQAFGWYYNQTISKLFQTFWGKPAAAQLSLPGLFTYNFLQIVTVLSLLGLGLRFLRIKTQPIQYLVFLAVVVSLVWGVTFLRGVAETLIYGTIPWARYAIPGFIPVSLLLCTGWQHIFEIIEKYLHRPGLGNVIFTSFMAGLALFTVLSVGGHYYPIMDGLQQLAILFAFILVGFWTISRLEIQTGV